MTHSGLFKYLPFAVRWLPQAPTALGRRVVVGGHNRRSRSARNLCRAAVQIKPRQSPWESEGEALETNSVRLKEQIQATLRQTLRTN